ncbi:MAG: RDD family protein [Planctomycetota bacterium]|nr:RDD family protein [Planctomycetota bacterium]
MNSNPERTDPSNPYSSPRSGVQRDPGAQHLASLMQRLGGALVDGVLLWSCMLAPALMGGDLGALTEALNTEDPELVAEALAGASYVATPILLLVLGAMNMFLLYRDGQTIGKRLVGSRIVRTSGRRAGLIRILVLRVWIAGLLALIPLVGPFVMILGSAVILLPARRCFHDYLADTKVIVV